MVRSSFSAQYTLYLSAAQIALAVVIAAVTATQLDYANGDCQLNLIPGRVCDFVYSTVGFSLLFTLMVAVPIVVLRRTGKVMDSPLIAEAGHVGLFGGFWWLVMSITITIRGNQAADAQQPEGAARTAVVVLSWIQTALFLATTVVVVWDRVTYRKRKSEKDDDASSQPSSQGEQYVYTQALAHTPVG